LAEILLKPYHEPDISPTAGKRSDE
jgi:hypothetical protein